MKRTDKNNIGINKTGLEENAKTKRNHSILFFNNKRGQAPILEYAIFFVCFIIAIIAMQKYIMRALQGRFRETAQGIGTQYDPGDTSVNFWTNSSSDSTTTTDVEVDFTGNLSTTTVITTNSDESTRWGSETVGAF
ncbi:hypothetical protein ACFL2J_00260 [Candidatus Omnitrophota bacterium]